MILIHPFSRRLKHGKPNPKNWPYWERLIELMGYSKDNLVQIGTIGDRQLTPSPVRRDVPFAELCRLVDDCDFFISIDSFLPHLAYLRKTSGIVIWSVSDPLIFGYPTHQNILVDRKYLRADQFALWEDTPYNADAFPIAETVFDVVKEWMK